MNYKKFLCTWLSLIIVISFATGLFNMLVDPYDVWRLYRRVGVNMCSVREDWMDRTVKPLHLSGFNTDTQILFLGNSKMQFGMDVDFYQHQKGKITFNGAVKAASLYEQRRFLEHALKVAPRIEEVVMQLDYIMFIEGQFFSLPRTQLDFDEKLLDSSSITPRKVAEILFSADAIRDGVHTIRENQREKYTFRLYDDSGTATDEYISYFHRSSNLFFSTNAQRYLRDGWLHHVNINEDAFIELGRVKDICSQHGIKIIFFIAPTYANLMMQNLMSWDVYSEWMRRMVGVVPVLDFSDINEFTDSEIKSCDTNNANRYFWDMVHMRKNIGEKIQRKLLDESVEPGFGVWVDQENVESHLQDLREKMDAWGEQHPYEIDDMKYFIGFSADEPVALSNKNWQTSRDCIRLDLPGGAELPDFNLLPRTQLSVRGLYYNKGFDKIKIYAMLTAMNGKRYFALTSHEYSQDLADYMRNKAYAYNAFLLGGSISNVDSGDYELCFLELFSDGKVYLTDTVAKVHVASDNGASYGKE